MKTGNFVIRTLLIFAAAIISLQSGMAFGQGQRDLSDIRLPDGFSIELWSDEVPNARSLALGDNGTVFVATRRDGRVFALTSQDNGPPVVVTVIADLKMPNGVAFHGGSLYVAELKRILRFDNIEENLDSIPEPVIVVDGLPEETHHGWRYIGFGPDDRLYVNIGAPCNICERPGFGQILRMNVDGSEREVYAEGVRNSVGLAWHPETSELWFTDNGRDMLGDNTPAGELNHAPEIGLHFGFPYCHSGDVSDPDFGDKHDCSEFTAPAQKLGPHVAPLGLRFYTGDMFPPEYRNQIFIAEHGSWNRSEKIGYRITLVRMERGQPAGYETFADGWLQGDEASGRPVDLLFLEDGSMLVSDDKSGHIYRISYAIPLNVGVGSQN